MFSVVGTWYSMARRRRSRRTAATRVRRRHRAAKVNIDSLIASIAPTVYSRLGLDLLGLSLEDCKTILRPIVEAIVEAYSSRPSTSSVLNKIMAHEDRFYVYVAAYILEKMEHYTPEQLSFIASYGDGVVCRYVPKLYEEASRQGLDDVIAMLRAAWMKHCNPPPYTCPRCGFPGVVPDLHCIVCGYELSEREFKEAVDFTEQLRLFAEEASVAELLEVRDRRVVLVSPQGIKPPSAPRSPVDVEVRLTRDEVKIIEEALRRRAGGKDSGS